eukprot:4982469-Amphidinium_carterae.2
MSTPTQWHMNVYSAVTMLNTRSLTIAFKQFCANNGFSTILTKSIEPDGTIKPQLSQYVTVAMGLHTHIFGTVVTMTVWPTIG